MTADKNPLFKPNLEAIGRKDGYEGHKPRKNFITDEKYRQAYSDGRAKKIDEELKAQGSRPSAWGFGNAGSGEGSFTTRGPLLGGGCLVLAVALAGMPSLPTFTGWWLS